MKAEDRYLKFVLHVLRARGQLRAVRLGNAVRFPLNENLARVLGNPDVATREGT